MDNDIPAHHLSLEAFSAQAEAIQLTNHGRGWQITFNGQDMGFGDGTREQAIRDAHRGAVNNALYANGSDAPAWMEISLPTFEALESHPELRAKFPAEAGRVNPQTPAQKALAQLPENIQQILHVFRFNQRPIAAPITSQWYYFDDARDKDYLSKDGRAALNAHIEQNAGAVRAVFEAWAQEHGRSGFSMDTHLWAYLAEEARLPRIEATLAGAELSQDAQDTLNFSGV